MSLQIEIGTDIRHNMEFKVLSVERSGTVALVRIIRGERLNATANALARATGYANADQSRVASRQPSAAICREVLRHR